MTLPTTIPELHSLILDLISKIKELESENSALREENANLRAQLKLNSCNSSKPPSTDGYKKKPAFPRKSNGKQGGQNGHNGKTLMQVETPDNILPLKVNHCTCGCNLEHVSSKLTEKHQVFDLPEPRLEITE